MGETDFSFGANYKDKVLFGASIGYINVRYVENSTYTETDGKDTIPYFNSFTYTQDLTSRGKGVNFNIGVIVKPNDWLRLGAAVHTPTYISMHDDYSSKLHSDLEDGYVYDTTSPDGSFDYRIITPFRAMGSVGFVINKIALINAEYEYVDYNAAEIHSSPEYFSDVNTTIHNKYKPAGNFRVGGEVRFDPFAFRLGYALYGSPYNGGENANANRSSYTAGIGFRQNAFFMDFAYVLTTYKEYTYLYDPNVAYSNPVQNNYKGSSFMLTFGVRF